MRRKGITKSTRDKSARASTTTATDARTPHQVDLKILPYSIVEYSDEGEFPPTGTPAFHTLEKRFSRLAQIITPHSGTVQSFDADDIAAALCELIDYFT